MGTANKDIKKLYGLSAGQCNICKKSLFDADVHIGEMAHVIAKSLNGPRGKNIDKSVRDSYQNLILLCANHHKEVDQNPNKYTVELLHKIKAEHESGVRLKLSKKEVNAYAPVLKEVFSYMGFTKMVTYFEDFPDFFNIEFLTPYDVFSEFARTNPHIYPFSDLALQEKIDNFINPYVDVINFFQSGYQTNVEYIGHYRETNNASIYKLNKHDLPYEYTQKALSQYRKDIESMISAYYELVKYIRSNFESVF
ncbi:HNH endonuclease [Pseudoalteromonas rhizosphaerae]|uniref:HNH endonuclease n=1 Tax=Pseudoalteromonas rhizosphaerae TaxID=2518973 RepID=A0ABW8KZB4_9GAMM